MEGCACPLLLRMCEAAPEGGGPGHSPLDSVGGLQICHVCLVAIGLAALERAQLGGDGPSVNSMCPLPVPPAPLGQCGTTLPPPQLRCAGPLPSSSSHWDPVHRALWLGCLTSPGHTPRALWPPSVWGSPALHPHSERAGSQAVSGHKLHRLGHRLESSLLMCSGSGARKLSAFGLKDGQMYLSPSPHSLLSLIPRGNVGLQSLSSQATAASRASPASWGGAGSACALGGSSCCFSAESGLVCPH